MKQCRGIWLPDQETYTQKLLEPSPSFAGAGTYQLNKLMSAFPHMHDFRHAVDIGAHVGMFSRVLACCFGKVTAFEPTPDSFECLEANTADATRCDLTLHHCALGAQDATLHMHYKPSTSPMTHVSPDDDGNITVPVKRLDDFDLTEVDFLKMDVEGFEYFVLQGGERTIRSCKPTVMIEQKPNNAERFGRAQFDAAKLLKKWGAEEKWNIGNDVCLRWKIR